MRSRKLFICFALGFTLILSISLLAFLIISSKNKLCKFKSKIIEKPIYGINDHLWKHLSSVPSGEDLGIVLEVKKIKIKEYPQAYNGALTEFEDGYLMVFRTDEAIPQSSPDWTTGSKIYSHICSVQLDSKLNQKSPAIVISTGSKYSQDPRIIKMNNSFYVIWNDMVYFDRNFSQLRSMFMGKLNTSATSFEYITSLKEQFLPIEKNWVPFISGYGDDSHLNFVYNFITREIFHLENLIDGTVSLPSFKQNLVDLKKMPWDISRWGTPRGGTPAILIAGEYFSFFHTRNLPQGDSIHFMGAYTFEASPPYRLTSMSTFPLFFHDAYTTSTHENGLPYEGKPLCLFPVGLVYEEKEGKKILQLSLGENDSSIKILMLNYDKLISFMKHID